MWIQELWSEVPNELNSFPWIHRFFLRLPVTVCLFLRPHQSLHDWIWQVFAWKYYPLAGVEIFKQTPCGLELGYSNLLFNFVVGTIKHQATGRQNAVVQGTDSYMSGSPFPPLRGSEPSKRDDWGYSLWRASGLAIGIGVRKRLPNKAGEKKKSVVPTCNTGFPCGFQFASEDSRFRSSADSRACLIGILVTCSPTCL